MIAHLSVLIALAWAYGAYGESSFPFIISCLLLLAAFTLEATFSLVVLLTPWDSSKSANILATALFLANLPFLFVLILFIVFWSRYPISYIALISLSRSFTKPFICSRSFLFLRSLPVAIANVLSISFLRGAIAFLVFFLSIAFSIALILLALVNLPEWESKNLSGPPVTAASILDK